MCILLGLCSLYCYRLLMLITTHWFTTQLCHSHAYHWQHHPVAYRLMSMPKSVVILLYVFRTRVNRLFTWQSNTCVVCGNTCVPCLFMDSSSPCADDFTALVDNLNEFNMYCNITSSEIQLHQGDCSHQYSALRTISDANQV